MPSQRRREKLRKLRLAAREKHKMDEIYEEARVLKCTVAGQALHLDLGEEKTEEQSRAPQQTWGEWWWSWVA